MNEERKNERQVSRGYKTRRIIATVLCILALILYLAITAICAVGLIGNRNAEGTEAIGLVLFVALYVSIGTIIYAVVLLFNVIALLLLNIKKPQKRFRGILPAVLAVASVATYFAFILILMCR